MNDSAEHRELADGSALASQRSLIRPLLSPTNAGDAMAAHYALDHDPRRTQLTLHRSPSGRVDGFAVVCWTGRDLFVPLVIVRARPGDVGELLGRALMPHRPYSVVSEQGLRSEVEGAMLLDRWQVNRVYELDARRHRSVLNVMVQPGQRPFRYEIRARDQVVAAAGVNWRSERLAGIYVYVEEAYQGRGWAKAVGSACIADLIAAHLLPLYTVSESNVPSLRLAESLGFRDSGAREFEVAGRLRLSDGT